MLRTACSVLALIACLAVQPFAQNQTPSGGASKASGARASKPVVTVNINTASAAELQQLPGIGAKTAARIVDYRQKKGQFKKIEELMNVQGIGEKNFLKLRNQLTVSGQTTANSQQ